MKLLTHRKQKWVERRKPEMLRAGAINLPAGVESRYAAQLEKMVDQMTEEVEKRLKRLYRGEAAEEFFAEDASISAAARILTNEMMKKFNLMFSAKSKPIAEQFIDQINKASKSVVYMNLKELSGGLSLPVPGTDPVLREIISASTTQNVALIKSISEKYLSGVQGAVMRSIADGGGLQTLIPYLEKQREITKRRAKMIALDQTRKAMNNLSAERMKGMGLQEFEWLHTGGSDEPRPLHKRMSGNIYRFDDPPVIDEKTGERGLPGQLPNCRCRMKMVLRLGDS